MAKPEIRLRGFVGEWISYILGDVGYTISGVGFPDKEQGGRLGTPFYKVSDMNNEGNELIMQSSNNYVTRNQIKRNNWKVYEKPALLFAKVGAAVLLNRKRLVLSSCLCDNNTMLYCFDENKWEPYFCLSLFQKVNLASLAQTGSLPSYNGSMVEGLRVHLPVNYSEQKIIANYFKSLDSMILTATKKISSLKQMKQACLISMFPQAGETTPRVRFKGFEGGWDKVKLSSIATRVTRKNTLLESKLPLTISAVEGLIEQTAFFNNVVASSNVSGYYLVKKGEFAYNKSYSNGYPFGAVKRLDRYEQGVLSTLYIVFSIEASVCSDYIVHFFDTSLWHKEVAKRAAEGARNHGLLNIGAEDFLDIDIVLPKDKDEQLKIASFFRSLDTQISLQEQRLEKLKQIKSACLDKMFV